MSKTWLIFAAVIVAILGVAAVACDDDESDVDNAATLCSDLAELDASVDNLRTVASDPSATIDELNDASDEVDSDIGSVQSSASDVGQDRYDDLESAYGDLDSALNDLSGDETREEALAAIQSELDAVYAAWAQYYPSAGC